MITDQNCGNCDYAGKEITADNKKFCLVKREYVKHAGICGYYMRQRKTLNSRDDLYNDAV